MSLSYSAITNHGKITLPSIESWSSNMSILKDPPKSITTRRIDKVGQTSDITAMIDNAGDRACGTILQYSRGINPSVSVQYNNSGNMSGKSLQGNNQQQAFLPYRVARDGAFRPPIKTQYDLLPLSRLPRVWTSSYTNKAFPDFTKKLYEAGKPDDMREIKNNVITNNVRPTAVYKIEVPQENPYDTKYKIQKSINNTVTSGVRTMDRTTQNVIEPTKEINRNLNHAFAQSNLHDNKYVNNTTMLTERFLQDTNAHTVNTIKGADHIQVGTLEDYIDGGMVKTKEQFNIDYGGTVKGNEQVTYIHDDVQLDRNIPEYYVDGTVKGNEQVTYIHDDLQLNRNVPEYYVDGTARGIDKVTYLHDDLQLNRNVPEYYVDGTVKGIDKVTYLHDDVELNRNIPEYYIDGTIKGNEEVKYIHNDVELDRVLPMHEAFSNQTQQGLQKTIQHEHIKELYNTIPVVKDINANKTGMGETNMSSRKFQLQQKISPGGFDNLGQKPLVNKVNNINENFESEKSKIGKKVSDQFTGRFETYAPYDTRFRQ